MTMMEDEPQDKKTKEMRSHVLTKQVYSPDSYKADFSFKPWDGNDPMGVHTTKEMLEALSKRDDIELDARVLVATQEGIKVKSLEKKTFIESFKKDTGSKVRFREDFFGGNTFGNGSSDNVGKDFLPLLGGPFYKNLYYYQDYIRMHAEAFFAYHNDPFAKAIVQITRDFVLGTGFELQCDLSTPEGKAAMACWKAFEEVNSLQEQIDEFCNEISIYGESMFWELPDNQTKIVYNLGSGEKPPTGVIPRVRLLDPSNMVEIVTYPEDISRRLFYVWLTPTQYQIYGSGTGSDNESVTPKQPTMKFIYRQIPADQILHFKVNSVSNEKRGRSDLFPVFNYLKRLRDSIDYNLIGLQKTSAWSMDTSVDGDQTDIDNYVKSQLALGTIPDAGSEFVHSKAVERKYLGNSHAGGHTSDAFSWCLSAIAAGVGIPVSYFGTHLSGGSTRASALVSTEPVAKKMEKRREVIKRCIYKLWQVCLKRAGLPEVDCQIIFPEIITQDRSQKLQDLLLMQQSRWIKPERAATIAAKEMGIHSFNYDDEIKQMDQQLPEIPMPLINPGVVNGKGQMQTPEGDGSEGEVSKGGSLQSGEEPGTTGLTSQDKKGIKQDDRTL